MKKSKIILPIAILLTLTTAAGVYASTDCERWSLQHLGPATTARVFHLKHKLSKKRVAEILAWNKAHPHYHPKTRRETLQKLDFACGGDQVATVAPDVTAFVPDLAAPVFTPDTVAVPDDTIPTEDAATDGLVDGYPYFSPYSVWTGGYLPFTPPEIPPTTPVPEPPPLALLLAGVLGLLFHPRRKEPTDVRSTR